MVIYNREKFLNDLFNDLIDRKNVETDKSYTSQLLKNPKVLTKKIGEESTELIIEVLEKNKKRFIQESADLFYHILVACIYLKVKPYEIIDALKSRSNQSGIKEKLDRKSNDLR